MITIVAYDISKNRIRNKVVKYCFNAGLSRIQKSIFAGGIQKMIINKLQSDISSLNLVKTDSVQFFFIPDDAIRKAIVLSNNKYLKLTDKFGSCFDEEKYIMF